MKKKLALITSIGILTLSLCSCQYFLQILGGSDGGYYFFPTDSARSTPSIVDVSTPPPGEIAAYKASASYADYIDNNAYPLSMTPSIGTAQLLVIPVWFTDSNNFISEAKKESVRQDIEKSYFGSDEDVGWKSVKTYYEQESMGSLTINGKVSEWYECGSSYTSYAVDPATDNNGAPKTSALVESAVDWYFNSNTGDFRRNYDRNGDGYLDGVMLIYAAPDSQTLDRDDYANLWAYCFWIQDTKKQKPASPGVNAFFWASYDFIYGSEIASSRTGKKYGAGDTKHCNLDSHTYIHEMGHMFGLEDYYDYSDHKYQPAGGFSMQDHNVGGHDPFSSYALGWGKAYVPTDTITIDLKAFADTGEMILLKANGVARNTPFDEYLLLEYYTPTGLNEFDTTYKYMSTYGKDYPIATKDSGIRLWHVDARLVAGTVSGNKLVWNPSKITTDVNTPRITLAMSNTYMNSSYVSVLAEYDSKYADYNILQLIRNNTTATYKPREKDFFVTGALFKAGDTFTMERYKTQFVNEGKMNTNTDLGFSFTVNACNTTYASIQITKL